MLQQLKPMLILLALLLGLVLGWLMAYAQATYLPIPTLHSGLTIQRLADVAQLATIRIEVADVLVSRIQGFTGGIEAAVLIKGDLSLAVDLSRAHFEQMDEARHTAALALPPPLATAARVDHEHTRVFAISERGLWRLVPDARPYAAVMDKAMAQAQQIIASQGQSQEADERARQHAQTVLQEFCRSLGWQVSIRWTDR